MNRKFEDRKITKVNVKSKENLTIMKALNMYGRVPEQWELLNELERLNKDLETALDICNQRQKKIVKLNNIIDELEKELDKGFEVYICNGRKVSKSIELGYKICQKELLRKLKALKEGKE